MISRALNVAIFFFVYFVDEFLIYFVRLFGLGLFMLGAFCLDTRSHNSQLINKIFGAGTLFAHYAYAVCSHSHSHSLQLQFQLQPHHYHQHPHSNSFIWHRRWRRRHSETHSLPPSQNIWHSSELPSGATFVAGREMRSQGTWHLTRAEMHVFYTARIAVKCTRKQ